MAQIAYDIPKTAMPVPIEWPLAIIPITRGDRIPPILPTL
jgi:hypothetical protein